MSRVYDQTCGRAARFLSASDLNNLTASAVRGYDNELSSFALAVADNDQRQIKYWKERILRSESAMLCAVVRSTTWKAGSPLIALADLKAQAKATDFFQPVNEPIHELIVEGRHVLRFGSKRRAMQTICADLLDVQLPTYEFDYLVRGRGQTAPLSD